MNQASELTESENKLLRFARKHDLRLVKAGEVGFSRPCVGLIPRRGTNYLDYNPLKFISYDEIFGDDIRLYAPRGVNAYHKHNCFAVLVKDGGFDGALVGLCKWIDSIVGSGDVEVRTYETGATGMQAIISGTVGYALVYKDWESATIDTP